MYLRMKRLFQTCFQIYLRIHSSVLWIVIDVHYRRYLLHVA